MNTRIANPYNFRLTLPYSAPKYGIPGDVKFAFSHFLSNIQEYKAMHYNKKGEGESEGEGEIDLTLDEETKQFIAYKTQEFIFDHIVDRINIAFKTWH